MENRHSLYKDSKETTNHILIHCNMTKKSCGILFLAIFGLKWVFPESRLSEKPSSMMENQADEEKAKEDSMHGSLVDYFI